MINGENFSDQTVKNNEVTYENIRKIATGEEDGYTIGCLLNYSYFQDSYKMIAVGLSEQQVLFTANLDRAGNTRIYFILREAK